MIDTIESENIKKNDEYFNEKKNFTRKKTMKNQKCQFK